MQKLKLVKQSTFSGFVLAGFLFAVGIAIAYSGVTETPTCADKGGHLQLIGYSTIHGQGKYLFAKYKCEVVK